VYDFLSFVVVVAEGTQYWHPPNARKYL